MAERAPEIATGQEDYPTDPARPVDKRGGQKAFDIIHYTPAN
jgi:hypothetical protein